MADDWGTLVRQARALEGQLESHLRRYSELNAAFRTRYGNEADGSGSGGGRDVEAGNAGEEEAAVEAHIDSGLSDLLDVTERMGRLAAASRSPTQSAVLKRYGEILSEHTAEYRSVKSSLAKKKDAARLFSNLQGRSSSLTAQAEPLLRERAAITQSSRAADDVLAQALASQENLRTQYSSIRNASSRFSSLTGKFPVINSIMDAINRRRSRNNMVIAMVIGGCICFTIWYVL